MRKERFELSNGLTDKALNLAPLEEKNLRFSPSNPISFTRPEVFAVLRFDQDPAPFLS
jgi:hypothetical protein